MLPPADVLLSNLASATPRQIEDDHVRRRAATALVIARSAGSILFMKRAERLGDPWSGQISFPGGHTDPGDSSLAETARRETWEEVGIELGEPLGRLDDCPVHTGPHTVVTPFVFELPHEVVGTPCVREVDRILWVPAHDIAHSDSWVKHDFHRGDVIVKFPGIATDGGTIWGLTYRCLYNFFEHCGSSLPTPPPLPKRSDP